MSRFKQMVIILLCVLPLAGLMGCAHSSESTKARLGRTDLEKKPVTKIVEKEEVPEQEKFGPRLPDLEKSSVTKIIKEKSVPEYEMSVTNAYRVKTGDRFSMNVFGEEEISGEFIVRSDGSVRHSLLGRVQVVGMSSEGIEAHFIERLGRDYLVNPKVSIQLVENEVHQIIVNGQVAKPGVYEFEPNERMTVLIAIARAGGLTDIARESAVKIVRIVDGKERIIRVNVSSLLAGKKPDVMLQADDRVWVPESAF